VNDRLFIWSLRQSRTHGRRWRARQRL